MTLEDALRMTDVLNAVVKETFLLESLRDELEFMFPYIAWRVEEDGIEAS